jgi:hypothetical protein
MDSLNQQPLDPVARQVGELHAKRLGRAAGGRILEQRFFALEQRYAALPQMMKSTQDPQLLEHSTRCNMELSGHPAARLLQAFNFLRQTYHQVYYATLNYNLAGARYLMTTTEVQMKDAAKVCRDVEASLVILESWYRAFRLTNRHNNLVIALGSMTVDYEHLRNQWQAIDPIVREGAVVRILSLHVCISAFEAHRGAAPQFLVGKQALDQSMGAITDAIAAHHFGNAEVLLRDAREHYTRLEHFIFNLGRAVQEYQAIETRVYAERARSEKRIRNWMNGISSPIDPEIPGDRPYSGLKSRFQLEFEQYYNQPAFGEGSSNVQTPTAQQTQLPIGRLQLDRGSARTTHRQTDGGRNGGLSHILHYPQAISPRTMAAIGRMAQYGPGELEEEPSKVKRDSGFASGPHKR